ncbi:MAG: glycoside hydrolase family 2 TIM barrel-domain containing protein [Hespellia sp.]|nr:glycoside hydrolase family 2 TIM barrel-domain containing protein [Hespellia sp.]
MKRILFNNDWECYRTGYETKRFCVTLPHDAMQLDVRSETSAAGVNTGWYEANDYTYEKRFQIPQEYEHQKVLLEFEGVYRRASIYINGKNVAQHEYGYTGFYVECNEYLKEGQENVLRVEVVNHDQPNSRWYTGTGIYRPVWLCILPEEHIEPDGISIRTLDYISPKIWLEVKTNGAGKIKAEIVDKEGTVITSVERHSEGTMQTEVELPGAALWEPEQPSLYRCRVSFGEDIDEEIFGIRKVSLSVEEGLCINGKRTILQGCCIHHDNGILGARAYDYAERRKVRILKKNGYNAIRSAHNPCSKALLRACDELGMLVMDEYVDVWYIHKTKYDYASFVEKNYKKDLMDMVQKDKNHPSVIMYSTGNEVSESAQKKGIELCGKFTDYLHELDPTRPVSCGINIFFNFLSSMGFGVYSDKKADEAVENAKKKKSVGSEFYNRLAGVAGAEFMKLGATLYPCDLKTKDVFEQMDIAGYNYGIRRYKHDLKKYPKRLIMGSETFCFDAYQFWESAKKEKRIIGDFVWAGMDYLGEVGIGAWEYQEYAPRFDNGRGWVSAGSGRIDLTGRALSEMDYTQVAFEQKKIAIGVVPVPYTNQKHSPSAWKMTNAIPSWSWNGCDGMKARVEVYCKAHHISLYVNGKYVGIKYTKKDCKVIFNTRYQAGELKAIGYDADNQVVAECILTSASEATVLRVEPEQSTCRLEEDLCYVRFRYTDEAGLTKPLVRAGIHLSVTDGEILGFGSACPYYPKGYLQNMADTYYGESLAVVRPKKIGQCIIYAESKFGCVEKKVRVV